MTLTVACYFWLDKARQRSYQVLPDHIRVWNSMIERNLTIPHRRVCITHRPDLIDFMETVPIDPTKHVPGTCAVKLMAHKPGFNALGDRFCLMDVDCVVTDNLNPVLDRPEPVVLWKNPNYTEGGRRGFYQGSMQLYTAGVLPQLWEDFDPRTTPRMLNRRFGGAEQAWISERLNKAWPEEGWEWNISYWDESDGVYGAGRLFDGKIDNGVQSELPENARIVFFPGNREPSQPEVRKAHPWIEEFYH